MTITQKIKENILSKKLFVKGDHVIVGVSGGADSIALLHILVSLQYEIGIQLHVAHFNHCLRKSADADELFVKTVANNLNLAFTSKKWSNVSSRKISSLEEKAREARLKFFAEVAKKTNTRIISLAHTQDDQAETVLMRVLRGAGLQGIRGILPRKQLNELTLIRPLLKIQRKEIISFLKKKRISYRTDPTNKELDFYRNKVRLRLIPFIEKGYNSNIKEQLSNLACTIKDDYALLESMTKSNFEKIAHVSRKGGVSFKLQALKGLHISQQRMLFRFAFEKIKGNTNLISWKHMQEVEDLILSRPVNSVVDLPGKIKAKKMQKEIFFTLSK